MQSIFIQIPSYRDFELNKTILSAIHNASGNVHLSFGIHLCTLFESEIKIDPFKEKFANIKYQHSIAPENIGLQKSRLIANEFYNGEDYYFQIDSHMRFAKDWDLKAIRMIDEYIDIGISKPLMTSYPPAYYYKDSSGEEFFETSFNITRILFTQDLESFKRDLVPSQTAYTTTKECAYTPSTSGGCIFTLGEFAKIKPNPKIAFWGEEPLIAARAFTHGFDLVTVNDLLVWHLYESHQPYSQTRRNHAWRDFPAEWSLLLEISSVEYQSIFIENRISDVAFGKERTLKEYEQFAGIDFINRKIMQDKWHLI